MKTRTIEWRPKTDVYVGQRGHICIKQDTGFESPVIISIHPDDVAQFIENLRATANDALDFVPEPDDEDTDAK